MNDDYLMERMWNVVILDVDVVVVVVEVRVLTVAKVVIVALGGRVVVVVRTVDVAVVETTLEDVEVDVAERVNVGGCVVKTVKVMVLAVVGVVPEMMQEQALDIRSSGKVYEGANYGMVVYCVFHTVFLLLCTAPAFGWCQGTAYKTLIEFNNRKKFRALTRYSATWVTVFALTSSNHRPRSWKLRRFETS